MTGGNDKITKGQSATLIICSILGVGILTLPSDLSKEAGNSGIIMILLGSILGILIAVLFTKLMLRFKAKTIVEIMDEVLPKPITIIFEVVFISFYIVSAAAVVRIFSDVVKIYLLPDTPLEMIIISMLLAVVYIVRKGIEGIARIVQFILPLVIIPSGIILLSLIPELDFSSINSIMKFNISDIINGLKFIFFSFIGIDIILVITAYVNDTKNILKYNISAISFLGFIYLIIFIVVICQFGVEQTKDLLWPTLFLMKTIDIPGSFLENLDGVIISLWTFIILQTISIVLMQANIILSKSLKLREIDFISMPLLPIIYLLALVPENIEEVYYYIGLFTSYLGTSITFIIPTIIFILAILRRKGASKA